MDLLRPIVRHLTYDAFLRRDGYRLGPHRGALHASQYFSPERLRALQLERLREIITFAHRHHPFYRRRFATCGFHPGDLRELGDLAALPLLTKEDLRRGLSDHLSDGFGPADVLHKRTGGSTGVPLRVAIDFPAASLKRAATERHNAWAGRLPGDRLAAVWGDTDKPTPWRDRLRNALTERAFYLDTLHFDSPHIEAFIARMRALRPPVLLGHAHTVYRLAEYARRHALDDLSLTAVITTAMVLSPAEREEIENVFQAPVFNRYGCEELSIIASECECHTGMHIFAEGLYVEFLGADETQPRELVITDLTNRAMPLIRYAVGDYGIVARGDCPCGRGLPRLREVAGRSADFLYTPEGVPVFGISILDTFVIHIPGIKQLQIVQYRYDHLQFHIVRDASFSPASLERLEHTIRQVFGPRMRYELHYVDRIVQSERGKYRFSICKIPGLGSSQPPADS
ncbi:MAG: phenylacetate--CoA ligase family protein [Candidatus Eisenbacteria sp.]|nr:phenylacetate--CoA ligase family protein [Candidatus Eisenbacteria bacterium]